MVVTKIPENITFIGILNYLVQNSAVLSANMHILSVHKNCVYINMTQDIDSYNR